MMVKISVVIPVYNAKDFLYESIPSLLNQTLTDIELICVNDGSKDNSLEILNEFARKDNRIKVIDKENGGCGSARNTALDNATGDYIYFFDPDDKIPENALHETYNSAVKNNSDMVIFKANIFDENGITNQKTFFNLQRTLKDVGNFEDYVFDYHEVKKHVLKGGFAPWAKLYKKEFLDQYDDFRFDIGLAFDDVPFHVKSMLRARRISFINKFLYHYRVDNPNSVNTTSSNGFDIFKIIDIVKEFLVNEGYFEEFKYEFYEFEVNHTLLYIISTDSNEYYSIARERFSKIDHNYIESKNSLKKFKLVMEIEDYYEFKLKYQELLFTIEKNEIIKQFNKLKNKNYNLIKENNKLIKENKKLKNDYEKIRKFNESLLDSSSWKLTKPLRKLKNLR